MSVHKAIKSSYLALKRGISRNRFTDDLWLLEQEVDTWDRWVSLPMRRRLWLLNRGFTSPLGKLYDFDAYGPEAYVSELQRYRLYRSLNGRHRYLLDDKLSQHWMLADRPANRPSAYGFVDRGSVHGVAGTEFDGDTAPVSEWLPPTLREESRIVLKKLRGKGGKEVIVCEYDGEFVLDGEPVSEETLCDEVGRLSGYLASEYVRQHAYADGLYPHATNTMRFLTLWDDETASLHTPIAVHRIGTERSRPVDNCSSGGLTAELDLATGELGRAAQLPFSGEVPWYSTHPDTGAPIEGTSVPNWESVRSLVERLARENTHVPLVGWDVVVDESGTPVVIEANTGSSLDLLQVHQPLLEDRRFAAVASRHLEEVDAPHSASLEKVDAPHSASLEEVDAPHSASRGPASGQAAQQRKQ